MAVIVLLVTFGTFVAMGLPIVTAVVGLVCGLSIITLLSHVVEVPTVAPTLATMIGLGVGIDYALFIVTRHLEQRRDGMATAESIARASATSGGAVVFAGCTVMVALLSLAVVNIPLVTTLGYTAALVVAVAILAAITLLPALLAVVGDRIDRLRLPLPTGRDDGHPHGWLRWGAFVARHPLPSALVAPGRAGGARAAGARPLPRAAGQRRAAAQHRRPAGLRRDDRGVRPGRERAAAGQRRPVREAGRAGQAGPRQAGLGRAGPEGQGEQAGDRQGAADRRRARGAGRPARGGAAAGPGAGEARARQAARQDLAAVGGQEEAARAAGDRPAAAGPQDGDQADVGREVGVRAARELRRDGGGAQHDADDGAVGPRHGRPGRAAPRRHASPRPPPART